MSEDTGDYVVVEHADAVAAMSHFIAAYIVTLKNTNHPGKDPQGEALE